MAMTRIGKRFRKLAKEGKRAFIPYIMAGDPSIGRTRELILMLDRVGADVIELGVPFSDPLADGPVIQQAAERAVQNGVVLRDVIALVSDVRKECRTAIVLMTYYNPIFKYGEAEFVRDAVKAGVDGVIVPDLPPDEAGSLRKEAKKSGLDTIFLFAPTSTEERRRIVAKSSSGFIYYVSITGITGSELKLEEDAVEHIRHVKETSGKPVAVGFGISTPEEAERISDMADGVIVGSAIVKRIGDPGLEDFLRSLREAIR
jgi:tryptophan synthase alpha chain